MFGSFENNLDKNAVAPKICNVGTTPCIKLMDLL